MADLKEMMVSVRLSPSGCSLSWMISREIHAARGVVALYHLWYLLEFFHYVFEVLWLFQVEPDKSAGLVAYSLWVYDELRTLDDPHAYEFGDMLVYRGAAHLAESGHFQKRNACVLRDQFQDF